LCRHENDIFFKRFLNSKVSFLMKKIKVFAAALMFVACSVSSVFSKTDEIAPCCTIHETGVNECGTAYDITVVAPSCREALQILEEAISKLP
jgi:transcription initiation factor TFIIIB Brf1 subunit/transcription initiation factor TFIIB